MDYAPLNVPMVNQSVIDSFNPKPKNLNRRLNINIKSYQRLQYYDFKYLMIFSYITVYIHIVLCIYIF